MYQLAFAVLLLPLEPVLTGGVRRGEVYDAIPSMRVIAQTLVDGFSCVFFGTNVVTDDCSTVWPVLDAKTPCDACAGAWVPVMSYIGVNFFYNVLLTLLLKHAGSTVSSMLFTLKVPVTSIAFSLPLLMGDEAEPLEQKSIVGLVAILVGLGIYKCSSSSSSEQSESSGGEGQKKKKE